MAGSEFRSTGLRVTMKDVAREAGVSASTVCRALNSNPRITEVTRKRVRAAVAKLGYRPDPLISALATRRRGGAGSGAMTVAFVTMFSTRNAWKQNPFYLDVYSGSKSRLEECGYQMEHFWIDGEKMTAERLSKVLRNRGVLGVYVAPVPELRTTLDLNWGQFSSVTTGYSLLRPELHRSAPHCFRGMVEMIERLKACGYEKAGFCLFSETSRRVDELWVAAAGLALRKYQLGATRGQRDGIAVEIFLFDDATLKEIPKWAREKGVDVVISDNTIVLEELQAAGIEMPGEIDFATLNWEANRPEIAGINQQADRIGAVAVDLLIGQIQRGERGLPDQAYTTLVEGRWVDGPSLHRSGSPGAVPALAAK